MKKTFLFLRLMLMMAVFYFVGFSVQQGEAAVGDTSEHHHIIIDTDTAGDDAMAIAMLVKAPNIRVEGVTVLAGNVDLEQGSRNALMTLEMAGKGDIPVYKGADISLDGIERPCFSVYGKDGMGDLDLIHPQGKVQTKTAVEFMLETIKKYPGEIEIVALGPVTNIAMAILEDHETMKKAKRIWTMGTAGFGPGNATPVAEFNVYKDPRAYKIVSSFKLPTTIIGLDVCTEPNALYSRADLDDLAKVSPLADFNVKAFSGLLKFQSEKHGIDAVPVCDPMAAATIIWKNFILQSVNCNTYVVDYYEAAMGMAIFYKEGFIYESMPSVINYNDTVVQKLDYNVFRSGIKELLK